ncbi:hypothetical protein RHMOL_Rhmol01G0150300 [Rhododendron molle]|uniref:Uncharacterized protein n=1 Tax=Rhododendron molle TaxID=49168 RepID=A0ACC0Q1D5_RHOML|nr:hypothetical protein RHMOL_Rhmol01G0150300 [Rhododendron molle]
MSSPTINHVVSFNQCTMISVVAADDQPCCLFQLINDLSPHRLFQRINDDHHVIADDQACHLFQSLHDD